MVFCVVIILWFVVCFFFSSRRRHTRCALVTGVQTCALPIWSRSPWTRRARCRSMRRADRRAPVRGFSLIEMLVAVAVLSLVALALLNLAGENTRTALVVEENVLAGIVADNRAVEAMLAAPGELSAHAEGTESAGDRRSAEHKSEHQSLM